MLNITKNKIYTWKTWEFSQISSDDEGREYKVLCLRTLSEDGFLPFLPTESILITEGKPQKGSKRQAHCEQAGSCWLLRSPFFPLPGKHADRGGLFQDVQTQNS